jgi:hypothetical protein
VTWANGANQLTALKYAEEEGHTEIAEMLKRAGEKE